MSDAFIFDSHIFWQVLFALLLPSLAWFAFTDYRAALKRRKTDKRVALKTEPAKSYSPTEGPSARDKHRAFFDLCRYTGVISGGNVTPEAASAAWALLGHPLRDHVIACGSFKKTMIGAVNTVKDPEVWLEQAETAAKFEFQDFIDAVTLHGAKLEMSAISIDALAERIRLKSPAEVPAADALIERRRHVRDAQGRIVFMRVIEVSGDGPVVMVDYNNRHLARYTITASGFAVLDGWYEPRGGARRRGPPDDDGNNAPVANMAPPGVRA